MSEQEQMKLDMVKNLALLLIEDQPHLTMEQALATRRYRTLPPEFPLCLQLPR